MDSKAIAVIVVFAAFTIVLNLSPIKIPAPYAPYLIYQMWEIPIVAAFLLFGSGVGVAILLINTAALLAIFPGELPTGPLYNLAAVLSMLLGVYLARALLANRLRSKHGALITYTTVGVLFRVVLMTIVNWVCLPFAPPIGFGLPIAVVVASLPLIGLFNATITLYTIPIGISLAEVAGSYVKRVGWMQLVKI